MIREHLKRCPFCGHYADKTNGLVSCSNDSCFLRWAVVTETTWEERKEYHKETKEERLNRIKQKIDHVDNSRKNMQA